MNTFFNNWSEMFTAAAIDNMLNPKDGIGAHGGIWMLSNSRNIDEGDRSFVSKTFWQKEIPIIVNTAAIPHNGIKDEYIWRSDIYQKKLQDLTLIVNGGTEKYQTLFDNKYKLAGGGSLFNLHIYDCGYAECTTAKDLLDHFYPNANVIP
eukprot:UN28435